VQTELQLVTSAPVQSAVSRKLGSAPGVTAAEVAQTNVIAVTAIAGDPAQAALIANTYAREFVAYQQTVALTGLTAAEAQLRAQIRFLDKQLSTLNGAAQTALVNQQVVLKEQLAQMQVNASAGNKGVALVTPAVAPTAPSSPKPVQNGLLGLVAGLVLGLAAAFLRDNLDDAVATKDAAEQLTGAPVLAMVPMVTSWRRRDKPVVIALAKPTAPAAEAYRSLRTSLQFAQLERELRTILVTSPAASEGKTSTLGGDGPGRGDHAGQIRLMRGRERGGHGDDVGIGLRHLRRGGEPAHRDGAADRDRQVRLGERRLAAAHLLDDAGVDIDPGDLQAAGREAGRGRQADVTEPDDGHPRHTVRSAHGPDSRLCGMPEPIVSN
jgi:capsular polysaccharide biosynthesis protein